MNERVSVALGERSYEIHVGTDLLANAGHLLAPFVRGVLPVVTDAHVAQIHLDVLLSSLARAGIAAETIIVPPGEETKSFAHLERLTGSLLKTSVDRSGLIVALGGGVIGDLAGLAAALLKRGIDFAQVPTTLLSQVDSSVGGKTAINSTEGKNLIGVFHQPRIVIADVGALATLPHRELLAGYAEVVKYGALGDEEFFCWLEAHAQAALDGNDAALTHLVAHCCRMKAAIVSRDEHETGERALLNLGHTFAHALEAATGYSQRLLHGEAVAIGIVLAFRLSERLKHASFADTERLERHLRAAGLPTRVADIPGPMPDADVLLSYMMHDKKVRDGRLTFVLARGIGRAFLSSDVPLAVLGEILGR